MRTQEHFQQQAPNQRIIEVCENMHAVQENIQRNFGMPQPNGYRKALRFMKHADHFGFPIITFVDTPGAYAGKNAEELGQVLILPFCVWC